jgi:16S rRNA (adenine1518-N6/adenine1519-N6)-dimethyltransferase
VSGAGVRALLERRGLRPQKKLGQNFLVDPQLAARMAERAGVTEADAVIEIGAGLGVLTRALAERARRVVALEVDSGLVRLLAEEGDLPDSVEVRHCDALDVDLAGLAAELGGPVRVVANLPYVVSSRLLRALLGARSALLDWSVLLQREMALRVAAGPGSRDYSSLAVLHALCVSSERTGDLRPGCFHPRPNVMSTALRLTPRADSPLEVRAGVDELDAVEKVVRAAFGMRRKTLANALRGSQALGDVDVLALLEAAGLDAGLRAEAIAPEGFLALTRAHAKLAT